MWLITALVISDVKNLDAPPIFTFQRRRIYREALLSLGLSKPSVLAPWPLQIVSRPVVAKKPHLNPELIGGSAFPHKPLGSLSFCAVFVAVADELMCRVTLHLASSLLSLLRSLARSIYVCCYDGGQPVRDIYSNMVLTWTSRI